MRRARVGAVFSHEPLTRLQGGGGRSISVQKYSRIGMVSHHKPAFLTWVIYALYQNVVTSEIARRHDLVCTDVLVAGCCADGATPVTDVDDDVATGLNQSP